MPPHQSGRQGSTSRDEPNTAADYERDHLTRGARVLAGQNQVLRLLAAGQPLETVLEELCHTLEAVMPDAACSVLLLDDTSKQLNHAAAPSLPDDFIHAINGTVIGPSVGSCGTAAFRCAPVIVSDIAADPLWERRRDLAKQHRLRSCWSVPIIDREAGRVLGTFAVYYREPRAPEIHEFALVEQCGDLAGVAIIHARNHAALLDAKEAAEAATRAKGAFLAMTSHELRTPLQAILGYTEFLLDDPRASLTAEQREDLGYIQQGGRRMLHIINQMLDLSRIDAGRLDVVREPVDLAPILEQVRQDVAPQANQQGIALRIVLPDALPPVLGDAERLRQILLNLTGNAVKFTDEGSVTLRAEVAGDGVRIHVHDTGVGIAPADLPAIFETFRQVDSRLARRHGGAGLGLAIALKLAGLMGGELTVSSTPGQGSTFTIWLSVAPA